MTMAGTHARAPESPRAFLAMLALLATAYGLWLAVFWPGVLGEDSVAILLEVQDPGAFRSGKTVLWYYFVRGLYQGLGRVEVPVAAALFLCAAMLARMLAWYWQNRRYKTLAYALLAVGLAPHMVYFMGMLYPDGLFAVAVAGLLFELWLVATRRTIGKASLAMIALTLPFAAFIRPNGLVFLVPAVLAGFWVDPRSQRWLWLVVGAWCALMFVGTRMHRTSTQETLFPLAAFETAGFLQKRAMNDLWALYPQMNDPWVLAQPKVSPRTVEVLERNGALARLQAYRDPVYWDMLVFHPEGPRLGALPPADKDAIVHEFLTYNLWHNLPDFLASRVNVLASAALAQGGFPALDYAGNVLPRVHARSAYRRFHWEAAEQALRQVHAWSHAARWLLWAPWLGFALLAWALARAVRHRDAALWLVALPMAVQLAAIFLFSIAGEYRYLLPFFTLPLVLLPALSAARDRAGLH
ncbi:Dolichyl-phosphate-mannose-protein mannosyltransferase [Paracidovorax anthurii]|uniref:Dolichyl-phosphate-mannose-protein mannosyltransferase n=2 Tax=Paracidovorax anthurii TaxID=78229 RepID=A0A328YWY5_9BURK|nr:hypothetical protein [Paracidovorax anthurii]RAR77285.1 hypothetical protein AX018_103820 [Paracidovorax anthurii]